MQIIHGIEGLRAASGSDLGHTEWMVVDQDRVDRFADATGDHQWIHVDPERAKASPFGGTIAHGYLTLSLVPHLLHQLVEVKDVAMVINYGLGKVRYPAPVRTGSRVRMGLVLAGVSEVKGGVQCQLDCTVEVEGEDKPAMVAEVLYRYYG